MVAFVVPVLADNPPVYSLVLVSLQFESYVIKLGLQNQRKKKRKT